MVVAAQIDFCAGHRLLAYAGNCRHVHGHNYKVEVRVGGSLNHVGFVIDFKELKAALRGITDVLDHSFIAHGEDPFVSWLKEQEQRRVVLNVNPTAENIAQIIFNCLAPRLARPLESDGLLSVRLWETPNNFAEAFAYDRAIGILEEYPCYIK